MKRFAIYYTPRDGAFASAAASWLGRDAARGCSVAQPDVAGIAGMTADPRRYGFHGTIKAPFRLADTKQRPQLERAVADLAMHLKPVEMPGLHLVDHRGFLALIPDGDTTALQSLAADVVRKLDGFRLNLTEAEIARRRPERLSPRQRDLLASYGYPYVMEAFQFHLTLSGKLAGAPATALRAAAARHFAGLLPQPFRLEDLCLFGEDQDLQFHLLQRYALSA